MNKLKEYLLKNKVGFHRTGSNLFYGTLTSDIDHLVYMDDKLIGLLIVDLQTDDNFSVSEGYFFNEDGDNRDLWKICSSQYPQYMTSYKVNRDDFLLFNDWVSYNNHIKATNTLHTLIQSDDFIFEKAKDKSFRVTIFEFILNRYTENKSFEWDGELIINDESFKESLYDNKLRFGHLDCGDDNENYTRRGKKAIYFYYRDGDDKHTYYDRSFPLDSNEEAQKWSISRRLGVMKKIGYNKPFYEIGYFRKNVFM